MAAPVEFKKNLGLVSAITLIVGSMIGSGILRLPGSMLAEVPSPWLVIAAWGLAALLTIAGALTFAELAGMFPRAGGQYVFLREGLGLGWSYMFGWTMFWVINTGIIAAVAVVFASFLDIFVDLGGAPTPLDVGFGTVTLPAWGEAFVAVGLIGLLSVVNYFGVKYGGLVQNLSTFAKAIGLLALVAIVFLAGDRHPQAFQAIAADVPSGVTLLGVFGAALTLSLFAYDGWPQATYVAGEVRNPKRNLPLALLLAPLATAVIYIALTFAYFWVVPAEAGRDSARIATDAARAAMGAGGEKFIGLVALVSTFGTVNAYVLTSPRIFYAMAKDGALLPGMAKLHPVHATPAFATVLTFLWSSFLVLTGVYEEIVTMVVFGLWLFYIPTAWAYFRLRRTKPNAARPFRTPLHPFVPLVFLGAAIFIVVNTLITATTQAVLALVLVAVGLLVYYVQIVRGGAPMPQAETKRPGPGRRRR